MKEKEKNNKATGIIMNSAQWGVNSPRKVLELIKKGKKTDLGSKKKRTAEKIQKNFFQQ